jgi:hypothetical protein
MEKRKENQDGTEDIIYGINSEKQAKINAILKFLEIEPRKRQNINFIKVNVKIEYFPKQQEVSANSSHS